jgi:hypothetical protein
VEKLTEDNGRPVLITHGIPEEARMQCEHCKGKRIYPVNSINSSFNYKPVTSKSICLYQRWIPGYFLFSQTKLLHLLK